MYVVVSDAMRAIAMDVFWKKHEDMHAITINFLLRDTDAEIIAFMSSVQPSI